MLDFDLTAVGIRIRTRRESLGLTQQVVADSLEISTKHYSEVERGIKGLSYRNLVKIRNVLNINIDYILTGEIENVPSSPFVDLLNSCPIEKKDYLEEALRAISHLIK